MSNQMIVSEDAVEVLSKLLTELAKFRDQALESCVALSEAQSALDPLNIEYRNLIATHTLATTTIFDPVMEKVGASLKSFQNKSPTTNTPSQ